MNENEKTEHATTIVNMGEATVEIRDATDEEMRETLERAAQMYGQT
jgi:hypothetical protein